MAVPFRPMTTEKLKAFLKEYLEENCKSPECSQGNENETHEKTRNKLIVIKQILETWRQRQLHS
nr:hypothetical protein 3 [Desulfobacteraceae bacterium]